MEQTGGQSKIMRNRKTIDDLYKQAYDANGLMLALEDDYLEARKNFLCLTLHVKTADKEMFGGNKFIFERLCDFACVLDDGGELGGEVYLV